MTPGFHKIAKYVVIPGIHQPSAPFECIIGSRAWDALSARDRELVELAAKMTTVDFWMKVGHEDARALEFYQNAGNEIIELDEDVQKQAKVMADEWAATQAAKNDWFRRVWAQQSEYEALWKNAARYRNIKR